VKRDRSEQKIHHYSDEEGRVMKAFSQEGEERRKKSSWWRSKEEGEEKPHHSSKEREEKRNFLIVEGKKGEGRRRETTSYEKKERKTYWGDKKKRMKNPISERVKKEVKNAPRRGRKEKNRSFSKVYFHQLKIERGTETTIMRKSDMRPKREGRKKKKRAYSYRRASLGSKRNKENLFLQKKEGARIFMKYDREKKAFSHGEEKIAGKEGNGEKVS